MSQPLQLSVDEQQWLLIVKAGGSLVPIPAEIAQSLSSNGLICQSGDVWSLTDAGIAEAERIALVEFQFNTPRPGAA